MAAGAQSQQVGSQCLYKIRGGEKLVTSFLQRHRDLGRGGASPVPSEILKLKITGNIRRPNFTRTGGHKFS